MNKLKIQLLATIVRDSGLYPGTPVYDRKSLLQRLARRDPSDRSGKAEEEVDMGYESSWSGIFTSTRG